MKKAVAVAVVAMMVAVAGAQIMEDFQYKAVQQPDWELKLASFGITNVQDRLNMATADSAIVASVLVEKKNLEALWWVWSSQDMGSAGVSNIVNNWLKTYNPKDEGFRTYLANTLPVQYTRDIALKPHWLAHYKAQWPTQPARAVYQVQADLDRNSVSDAIKVLVAAEPLYEAQANEYRTRIKDVATKLARKKLRQQGKTFVVSTNGINPLVAAMAPVMTALNAPCMDGLEAAFQAQFGVTVDAHDRAPLLAQSAARQAEVMDGTYTGGDLEPRLPKLAVLLGTTGYNAFIDTYNKDVQ